jgi:hypothetical protein
MKIALVSSIDENGISMKGHRHLVWCLWQESDFIEI